jgi:hypothetical protein
MRYIRRFVVHSMCHRDSHSPRKREFASRRKREVDAIAELADSARSFTRGARFAALLSDG